jgi:uncharacterized protein (TIRG00374 family)
MSSRIKIFLSILVLLLIAILFFNYIAGHWHEFKQLKLVSPFGIAAIWLMFAADLFVDGLVIKFLLAPFGIKLNNKEAFSISTATRFYNFIMPLRGGIFMRAVYLKKQHKFPYTDFLSALSSSYIIIFLISSFAGALSMILIWLYYKIFNMLVFLLFFGAFIALLLIANFSPRLPKLKNKWLNRFVDVINGWHLIKSNRKAILTITLMSLCQLIVSSIALLVTYGVFGIEIGFAKTVFITSISHLSTLVALTPGNLGVGEAINVFSASLVGISPVGAIAAVLFGRLVNAVMLLVIGPIFSYMLMKDAKKNETKNQTKNKADISK